MASAVTSELYHLKNINKGAFYFSWPGRAHDARVWQQSPLCKDLPDLCYVEHQRLDQTFHIIGDCAYPMSNHLLSPFRSRRGNINDAQKKFNTHLASKRSVIERAFGLLGLRFPRLLHLTAKNNTKRIRIVVAACVLHNWCIMEDDHDEEGFEMLVSQSLRTDISDDKPAEAVIGRRRALGGGNTKRNILCDYIAHMN